uniref:Uncharacterized protein n=1 Tax=Triticum urartu TaxID=4572 RepID=A0A8R7QCH8_TRIUA
WLLWQEGGVIFDVVEHTDIGSGLGVAEVVGELYEAGVDRSDGSTVRSWQPSTEKTTMALATQYLGLRRRPGPIKSSAVELLDALPHAGDAGGRDNDDGAAVTVGSHELDSVQRGRGTMGIEEGTIEA